MYGQSALPHEGALGRAKTLDDVPPELLKDIVALLDAATLLKLQQVSSAFHKLASEVIYQNLDFNITCSSADVNGDINSRAADALQTLNISEYQYASHTKSFRLGFSNHSPWTSGLYGDPTSQTRTVFDSSSDASKLLNTSILQMVRRTEILETFKWDLPVELNGYVYRALQNVKSLNHLFVRLDGGPPPKPPPRSSGPLNYYPPPPLVDPPLPHDLPSSVLFRSPSQKRRKGYGSSFWAEKRAFAGFTRLQTLEITQLTSLEGLGDLRQCIKSCSSSLRNLTLTVNSRFGSKAQRSSVPPPPNDYDSLSDTEPDDDDYLDAVNSNAPEVNEADRRQEKMALESLLANLFDLQDTAARAQRIERKMGLPGGKCLLESDKTHTLKLLKSAFNSMQEPDTLQESESRTSNSRIAKVRIVKELADLYISQHAPRPSKSTKTKSKSTAVKKTLNAAKYPLQSYPPPTMPADSLLDHFDFDEFLEENVALSSPGSLDSPIISPNPKPWPSTKSKYSMNDPIYIDEPLPPLHSSTMMSSSHNPITTSINADLHAFSPSIVPPFSATSHLSTAAKSSSINKHEFPPYHPPQQPYSIYADGGPKVGGKSPKVKYKPYQKHGSSKPPGSGSGLYSSGPGSASKNFGPPMNISYTGSKLSKGSGKSKPAIIKKYKLHSSSDESKSTSEDESDSSPITETPPETMMFKAASDHGQDDEGPDIDMEHPDVDDVDLSEDQGTEDSDSSENIIPRRDSRPPASTAAHLRGVDGTANADDDQPVTKSIPRSADDKMHEYIRTTHGIQLEVLRLQYVPLKASILGRALDLRAIRNITLLETGPQDAFWSLLVKLTDREAPIAFKSIHTDHISMALLKYLSGYAGLEGLYLHERRAKKKESDSGIDIDINLIRRLALRPHIHSLKRLMLRNERSDSWDFDFKTIHMLATQAKNLEEMAISLKTSVYHGFLQILPAFQSLYALHLISLRGGDRNTSLQLESLAFSVDSLVQCAELKLRYLAISERATEITGQAQFRKQLKNLIDGSEDRELRGQVDKKGKGKAVEPDRLLQEVTSDQELDARLAKLQAAQRRLRTPRRFDEITDVKIFSLEIRTGRL